MDKKRDSFSLVQALEQSISKLVEKFLPKNNFTVFAQGELTKLWAEIEQMEPKRKLSKIHPKLRFDFDEENDFLCFGCYSRLGRFVFWR